MVADRIINSEPRQPNQPRQYFVKWNNLQYEFCTWESVELMQKVFPNVIMQFEDIQTEERKLSINPLAKSQALKTCEEGRKENFIAYKKQPKYISGGKLYDYQLEGLNWILYSWYKRKNII